MRLTVNDLLEVACRVREVSELTILLHHKLRVVHRMLLPEPDLAGTSMQLIAQFPESHRVNALFNQLAEHLAVRHFPSSATEGSHASPPPPLALPPA